MPTNTRIFRIRRSPSRAFLKASISKKQSFFPSYLLMRRLLKIISVAMVFVALATFLALSGAKLAFFLNTRLADSEKLSLPYRPGTLSVDEEAEKEMLELINAERIKVGIKPLVVDQTLVKVARMHSTDMWERKYFSHEDPDNKTPFNRLEDGEVEFRRAGENLALARDVKRAHEGLMDSEGHRKNILDSNFGRVGIGVIDGGIYGKMFTQNFAD